MSGADTTRWNKLVSKASRFALPSINSCTGNLKHNQGSTAKSGKRCVYLLQKKVQCHWLSLAGYIQSQRVNENYSCKLLRSWAESGFLSLQDSFRGSFLYISIRAWVPKKSTRSWHLRGIAPCRAYTGMYTPKWNDRWILHIIKLVFLPVRIYKLKLHMAITSLSLYYFLHLYLVWVSQVPYKQGLWPWTVPDAPILRHLCI